MDFVYPDIDWYTGISEQKHVQPRCPYANVHRCYRYYASIYLFGEAKITTQMEDKKIHELEAFWKKSELFPVLAEQDTGISGPNGKTTGFSNFCPEVSYDVFGLFATSLHKYADEIDIETAHKQLGKRTYSKDWRWNWASVSRLHYLECPAYSQLLGSDSSLKTPTSENNNGQDLIEVKPGFMGISINLKSLLTRLSKWWLSKQK